jgi:hypothetical protein
MAKKIRAKRGRRSATIINGKEMSVGLQCHKPFLQAVDRWREKQKDKPTRPAAIVRLAELGLAVSRPRRRTNEHAASMAKNMAGEEIDRLSDQSASTEEQASRKLRLIKGPAEFRDFRKDHSTKSKT